MPCEGYKDQHAIQQARQAHNRVILAKPNASKAYIQEESVIQQCEQPVKGCEDALSMKAMHTLRRSDPKQ